VARVIEETIRLAKSDERFGARDFSLETDIEPLPRVVASKNQLRQALLNILINALDAAPDGGIVRVKAGLVDEPSRPLKIAIANQGPPIPAETQAHIFEPFFTTKATGTGLGLPIASQVATNHGGKLSLDCHDGWVTFTMTLPVQTTPVRMATLNEN
jgi:signal transduction histidine kinase